MESSRRMGRKGRERDAVEGPPLKRRNLFVEYLNENKNRRSSGRKLLLKKITREKLQSARVYIKPSEEALCIKAWKNNNVLSLRNLPEKFTNSASLKRRENNNEDTYSDLSAKKLTVSFSRKASKEELLFLSCFKNFEAHLQDAIRFSIMRYCLGHQMNSIALFKELQRICFELIKYSVNADAIIQSCLSDKTDFKHIFQRLKELRYSKWLEYLQEKDEKLGKKVVIALESLENLKVRLEEKPEKRKKIFLRQCVISLERLDEDMINLAIQGRSADKLLIMSNKNETFRNLENTHSDISQRGREEPKDMEIEKADNVSSKSRHDVNSKQSLCEKRTLNKREVVHSSCLKSDKSEIVMEKGIIDTSKNNLEDTQADSIYFSRPLTESTNSLKGTESGVKVCKEVIESLLNNEAGGVKGQEMNESETALEIADSRNSSLSTYLPNETNEGTKGAAEKKELSISSDAVKDYESNDRKINTKITDRSDAHKLFVVKNDTYREESQSFISCEENDTENIDEMNNSVMATKVTYCKDVDECIYSPQKGEVETKTGTEGRQPLIRKEDMKDIEMKENRMDAKIADSRCVYKSADSLKEVVKITTDTEESHSFICNIDDDMKGIKMNKSETNSKGVNECIYSLKEAEGETKISTEERESLIYKEDTDTKGIEFNESETGTKITDSRSVNELLDLPNEVDGIAADTEESQSLVCDKDDDMEDIEMNESKKDIKITDSRGVSECVYSPKEVEGKTKTRTEGRQSSMSKEDSDMKGIEMNDSETGTKITDSRSVDECVYSPKEAEGKSKTGTEERESPISKEDGDMKDIEAKESQMDRRVVNESTDSPNKINGAIEVDTQKFESLTSNGYIEVSESEMTDSRSVDESIDPNYETERETEAHTQSLKREETIDMKGIGTEENEADREIMDSRAVDEPTDSRNKVEEVTDADAQEKESLIRNKDIDSETGRDITDNRAIDEFADSLREDEGVAEGERTENESLIRTGIEDEKGIKINESVVSKKFTDGSEIDKFTDSLNEAKREIEADTEETESLISNEISRKWVLPAGDYESQSSFCTRKSERSSCWGLWANMDALKLKESSSRNSSCPSLRSYSAPYCDVTSHQPSINGSQELEYQLFKLYLEIEEQKRRETCNAEIVRQSSSSSDNIFPVSGHILRALDGQESEGSNSNYGNLNFIEGNLSSGRSSPWGLFHR